MSDDVLNIAGIRDRHQQVNLDVWWKDIRREYTDSVLDYEGKHYRHDASTADTEWCVWKYTYTGSDLVRIEGPLVGAWDNRATLDWGS